MRRPNPSPAIVQLLSVFAIAFTAPTYKNALILLYGAILTPGRRTISAALRVMGLADEKRFGKYHRVLSRARWDPLLVSRLLLGLIIELCVPTGTPLVIAIDETLERRWGAKIKYKSVFRDAVRSSRKHVVYHPGIRWLTAAVLVSVPWSGRQWALPFLTVPLLSPKTSAKLGQRHRTSIDRAAQIICQVRRWQPQRPLIVIGDGGFAAVSLVRCCQRKHIRATFVSRMRLDARLFDPPPDERPSGRRGPKPQKGNRQPNLATYLEDDSVSWTSQTLAWYGGKEKTVEICSGSACWHTPGQPPVPIRWVLVRCPDDENFEPSAFFCSVPEATATQIITWFIARWNIEVTFEEARALLGFNTQRQWSDTAIERTTLCLLGLFSLVVLMAKTLHPTQLPLQSTTWYDKHEATFSDALAAVRSHLWRLEKFVVSPDSADTVLISTHTWRALRQVVLYSV